MVSRRILITGGSRGIGAAVAEHCRAQGDEVLTVARSKADLVFDVTLPNAWYHAALTLETLGGLDGLVTCAAVYGPIGSFSSCEPWRMEECLKVNLLGTMYALSYCLPALKQRKGRAVLLAGGGKEPVPNYATYKATKAGVMALAENVAAENEIEINCVRPGFVATDFHQVTLRAGGNAGVVYEFTKQKLEEGGRPMSEVVELIDFLLSDRARGITGQVLSEIPS